MRARAKSTSRILEAVRETARDLYDAGVMDKTRMARYEVLQPLPEYSGRKVRALRRRLGVTQDVFASFLNISVATVRQWENGERQPRGTSLRLLDILDRKGAEVLVRD